MGFLRGGMHLLWLEWIASEREARDRAGKVSRAVVYVSGGGCSGD